jgi:hypothetical protein
MERLLSEPRMDPHRDTEFHEQPRPKAVFDFLDRRIPVDANSDTPESLPVRIGTVALYGRQTDREARVQIIVPRSSKLDGQLAELGEILGDTLGEKLLEKVIGRVRRLEAEFDGELVSPPKMPPEVFQKLRDERLRAAISKQWSELPNPLLGGRSPREAANIEMYRVPILADLFEIELFNDLAGLKLDVDAMRADIGFGPRETIDLSERSISQLPVSHYCRLDLSRLSDDDLVAAYRYAYAVNAGGILRKVALEVVSRDSLGERADKVGVYSVLAELAHTTDESLEWLEKSRKLATAEGESPVFWLIDELKLRIFRREPDKCRALVNEITSRYLHEPGVQEALSSMLHSLGFTVQDGLMASAADIADITGPQPAALDSTSKWTDEALGEPEAPIAAASKPAASKLWLPDMD